MSITLIPIHRYSFFSIPPTLICSYPFHYIPHIFLPRSYLSLPNPHPRTHEIMICGMHAHTPPPTIHCYSTILTCAFYRGLDNLVSGKYIPNRFLIATRCLLNLSSGLKRAGWADSVTFPSGLAFYYIIIIIIMFPRGGRSTKWLFACFVWEVRIYCCVGSRCCKMFVWWFNDDDVIMITVFNSFENYKELLVKNPDMNVIVMTSCLSF